MGLALSRRAGVNACEACNKSQVAETGCFRDWFCLCRGRVFFRQKHMLHVCETGQLFLFKFR